MEYKGTPPRGVVIMRTLYELLAEQKGVEFSYKLEQDDIVLKGTTAHRQVSDLSHKGKKEA